MSELTSGACPGAPPRTLTLSGRLVPRGRHGRPAAPVRRVHLGLGAFFRARQAWHTERATDASEWGAAAFAGRSWQLAPPLVA